MRQLFLATLVALVLPLSVSAQGATADWTNFEEPSEKAFTIETPKNWHIESGTARRTPSAATPWIKASSKDGLTDIFAGDPSLPKFVLPGSFLGPEGKSFTGPGGTTTVARYQTGKEFAIAYGPHLLPEGSENVKLEQAKDEPGVAARNPQLNPGTTASAGSALFSYELHGQKQTAGVVAQTMLCNPTGVGGSWNVFDVYGFHTKAGNENTARALAEHMRTSRKFNPEWAAAMMKAINDEGARGSAMLQQQHQQFNQWMNMQNQQFNQRMAVQHQQSMDQIQAVGDRARAQAQADAQWHQNAMVNHYANMANKDFNNYKQVLQIQGKHLEWSPDLQRNVEVPNY